MYLDAAHSFTLDHLEPVQNTVLSALRIYSFMFFGIHLLSFYVTMCIILNPLLPPPMFPIPEHGAHDVAQEFFQDRPQIAMLAYSCYVH